MKKFIIRLNNQELEVIQDNDGKFIKPNIVKQFESSGSALKPAWEPIIVAMKPLEGTYAENAQKWGVAGLNIDGGRIGTEGGETHKGGYQDAMVGGSVAHGGVETDLTVRGRWPANLLLDEEAARLLDEQNPFTSITGARSKNSIANCIEARKANKGNSQCDIGGNIDKITEYANDKGGASRFFYCAKASKYERNAGLEDMPEVDTNKWNSGGIGERRRQAGIGLSTNTHPTIKPVSLMRYLCKLTKTPTGGVVLDPFMGSGSTGIACVLEGREFIGIEISKEYCEIAEKRIANAPKLIIKTKPVKKPVPAKQKVIDNQSPVVPDKEEEYWTPARIKNAEASGINWQHDKAWREYKPIKTKAIKKPKEVEEELFPK